MSAPDPRAAALLQAMKQLARGDQSALSVIYQATSAKLFGICLRILGDRSEAEDALQDVYLNLWQRADRFEEGRTSPISWLATFARNRAIDRLRRRGRFATAAPIEDAAQVADHAPLADEGLLAGEQTARIEGCLGKLEQRQGEAIRSAFYGGFSYPELAERARVPLGTVKSWVRRGLGRLKECLES